MAPTPAPAHAPEAFDLDAPWTLGPRVAIRREPFGALAYHFGTRRLSFLKSPELRALVEALADHPSARTACAAVGIVDDQVPMYARSLATLARTRMIVPREDR